MLAAGIKQWLEHEIAYVERGKRFSGAISRADMGSAQLWLMLSAMQAPIESPADPRSLSRLPPSQLQLGRAVPLVLELEPREMLAFFDKHDPAGYPTAGLLGAASIRNPSPYVKAAAETFYRERGIQGGPSAKPDPRYASPEKTWALFLAAGKKGDAAGMLDCLTPEMQGRFQDLFKRMSRDDLRKMSESFVGFALTSTYGEFSEAMVVRKGDRNLVGPSRSSTTEYGKLRRCSEEDTVKRQSGISTAAAAHPVVVGPPPAGTGCGSTRSLGRTRATGEHEERARQGERRCSRGEGRRGGGAQGDGGPEGGAAGAQRRDSAKTFLETEGPTRGCRPTPSRPRPDGHPGPAGAGGAGAAPVPVAPQQPMVIRVAPGGVQAAHPQQA